MSNVPFSECWLSIADVALLLGCKLRTAARKAALPDFPIPRRDGHPRWKACEVQAWADRQRMAA